jgi:hypothetical protein
MPDLHLHRSDSTTINKLFYWLKVWASARHLTMMTYIFSGHQKFVYGIFKNFMICGLEVNIEMDFIDLRYCSIDWIKVADDNVHWWTVCVYQIPQVCNNVVLVECCHPWGWRQSWTYWDVGWLCLVPALSTPAGHTFGWKPPAHLTLLSGESTVLHGGNLPRLAACCVNSICMCAIFELPDKISVL